MKILSLEHVGCLQNVSKQIDLGQNVFIYGLNGAGKSTLKDLFKKSFYPGAKIIPSFGKSKSQCNALVEILNKKIEFKKASIQNNHNGEVHGYDTEYVENNIYVNGSISDNNKKEYYRLFVGDNINAKINNMLVKCNEISTKSEKIFENTKKFHECIDSIESLFNIYERVKVYCSTKMDISYALEDVVKRRIEKNISTLTDYKATWLRQGKKLQINNICPYCGRVISDNINNELISHYENIINLTNENIVNYKKEGINLKKELLNLNTVEIYYNQSIIFDDLIDALIEKLDYKIDHLAEKISIDCEEIKKEMSKGFEKFKKFINDFDAFISSLVIDDIFSISEINDEYSKNISKKFESMSQKIAKNITIPDMKADLLNYMKEICRNHISVKKEYLTIVIEQNNTIATNIAFINSKLKEYDFKYSLQTSPTISQKNIKTRSNPIMELLLVPNDCNTVEKKMNKDDLKDVLSEGEKSILSWVFFVLDLKGKLKKGKHLIIIDDPISSYDSYRRFNLSYELGWIIKEPAYKEILLLSHEKSFSNVIVNNQSFKTYIMKNGKIEQIDISKLIESDFKEDILKLKKFGNIDSKKKFIEFMIVSRNVLDYYKSINDYVSSKYFRTTKYKENYDIASSIIHLQRNSFPKSYLEYIQKIMKKIISGTVNFKFENINFEQLDLSTALNNIDNIYLARVKINKKIIDLLESNHIEYDTTGTTGELINTAFEKEKITLDEYKEYKKFLPLLNVYNHVNDNYGLRRIDCTDIQNRLLFEFVNRI